MLSGLRERYMELFGTMLSTSGEAQRLYSVMLAAKQQAEKALKGKDRLATSLQQQLLKSVNLCPFICLLLLLGAALS